MSRKEPSPLMAKAEVAQALIDGGLRLGVHPGRSRALSLARAVRGVRPAGPAPLSSPEATAPEGEQACSFAPGACLPALWAPELRCVCVWYVCGVCVQGFLLAF